MANVDPSKTATGGLGERGVQVPQITSPLLSPYVATAAGRFVDPLTDSVLGLRLTKPNDGLLTLSAANGTEDVSPCEINQTCWINVGRAAGSATVTAVDRSPGLPVASLDNQRFPGAADQWWTLDGDGVGDGYFRLVSEAYGLCLELDRDALPVVLLAPCQLGSHSVASQLWKFVPHHVENGGAQTTDGFMIAS